MVMIETANALMNLRFIFALQRFARVQMHATALRNSTDCLTLRVTISVLCLISFLVEIDVDSPNFLITC